jgi:hypothetical protein
MQAAETLRALQHSPSSRRSAERRGRQRDDIERVTQALIPCVAASGKVNADAGATATANNHGANICIRNTIPIA